MNKNEDIELKISRRFGIIFMRYTYDQKVRNQNSVKVVGSMKPNGSQ